MRSSLKVTTGPSRIAWQVIAGENERYFRYELSALAFFEEMKGIGADPLDIIRLDIIHVEEGNINLPILPAPEFVEE